MKVSQLDAKKTAKSLGFTYKVPDARRATFGGVPRNDEGDVVNVDALESDGSSMVLGGSPPIDYVVITELTELFERAVSKHGSTLSFVICQCELCCSVWLGLRWSVFT